MQIFEIITFFPCLTMGEYFFSEFMHIYIFYDDSFFAGPAAVATNGDEGRTLYEWVKDYEMKVQSHHMEEFFSFYLDERSRALICVYMHI